jgi:hypothetical protein
VRVARSGRRIGRIAAVLDTAEVSPRARGGSFILASTLLLACGARTDISTYAATMVGNGQPNECATRNASYLVTFLAMDDPGCGSVPPLVIQVAADGTVADVDGTGCARMQVTGCTNTGGDCVSQHHFAGQPPTAGVGDCTSDYSLTFSADGSSISGQGTISCALGSDSCRGGYSVTGARR